MRFRSMAVSLVATAGVLGVAGCDDSSPSATSSEGTPAEVVGTWWEIDSTPEAGYSNHDTAWVVFAADGKYAEITRINSLDLSSGHRQISGDTSTGTWSAGAGKLKITVSATTIDKDELKTLEMSYTVKGTVLSVINTKGNTHNINRYPGQLTVPTLPDRVGVFR